MNSSVIKIVRWLLFPFACIYGVVVFCRNYFYKIGIFKSNKFDVPTICVGNISVGGTGKSPMVQYIAQFFAATKNVATLSRGYGRNTKGFLKYDSQLTPATFGDEPFMLANNLANVTVAVCEDRVGGVQQLMQKNPSLNLIVLDDALQHRKIEAKVNIVLVDYNHPPFNDFYLPTGNLRDAKIRLQDAHIVVVTKCPIHLNKTAADNFASRLKLSSNISLFFTSIQYDSPKSIFTKKEIVIGTNDNVLLITGLAQPFPFLQYLQSLAQKVEHIDYKDHYNYSQNDIEEIITKAKAIANCKIITSEKDAVKLKQFKVLQNLDVFSIGITPHFLFGEEKLFQQNLLSFL